MDWPYSATHRTSYADNPDRVAVNGAVELADALRRRQLPAIINGFLDKLIQRKSYIVEPEP